MSDELRSTIAGLAADSRAPVPAGSAPAEFTIGLYHGPLYLGPNGYETYRPYAGYVKEFARRFARVVVFAPVSRGDTVYRGCRIDLPNVDVVPLPEFSTHLQAARHVLTIFRAFRREIGRLDVINCRNVAPFGSMLYFLGRRRGIGFFYEFASNPWQILTAGTKYRGVGGVLSRLAYLLAFQVQKFIMRRTYSFIDGPAHYDFFARYTPRIESLICSTLEPEDFRARSAQILHDPVRLLFIGYLKHMKGLDFLLDALAQVRARGTNAELHLVGDGPLIEPLRNQAASLGMEDCVRFHGFVSDASELHRRLDESDIFVFPSLSEGSPRVVLEALARGLPLISTPVGSVPDVLVDGESVLLVPFRDSCAIADAVSRLVQDEALRTRVARRGYEIAQRHTVSSFVGRMADKAIELARRRDQR